MIGNAINTYQFIQLFNDSPETQAQFTSQLSQIQNQLSSQPLGQQVIDQLVDIALIRQEAEKRGIAVTKEEVDQAIREAFGYFPEGTPTPRPTLETLPTSTLSVLQLTAIPPTPTTTPTLVVTTVVTSTPEATATATLEVDATVTPTLEPSPTPTEYTQQAYDDQFNETVNNLKDTIGFNEQDLRGIVEDQLYREKVSEAITNELAADPVQEQVWARHILVPDESLAQVVIERLNSGEDWNVLAAELSTDESNKNQGGDLGWFDRNRMVSEFADAAFNLAVGEISAPVETQFGWHIIQVLGHEGRPLTDSAYQQLKSQVFEDWLTEQRDAAEIEIRDYWTLRVPTEPTLPAEISNFIASSQQQQPQLPLDLQTP